MHTLKHLFSAIALALLASIAGATETPLRNWEFSQDGAEWQNVSVPHSWNAEDGHSPAYFRGKGYYRTVIDCKDAAAPAFLRFEGAAQTAEVFVNGQKLAYHRGGYTPFTVKLSGSWKQGANLVEVICDNSPDMALIPISSDFNKNGGLHNPVSLLQFPEVYLAPEEYGFDRFHLVQKDVSAARAVCELRTKVCNSGTQAAKLKLQAVLRDASGKAVKKISVKVSVPAGESASVAKEFKLRKPHLWNGRKDPYLYTLELIAGEDVTQGITGFRFFAVDREKGFSLNGETYPLRGVSMHQDIAGKASAMEKPDYDLSYAIVDEIGCNFLRLAHYPHNNYAFHICDSLGMVVQTEIPWVNVCGVRATQPYFENIHSQMKEMITALYNHPSIVFWGMWNELDRWGNKEEFQGTFDPRRVVDETAKLYAYAKELDPTRAIGFTDDSKFRRPFYKELKADFYSQNCYYGWYYTQNDFSGLTPLLTWIRDTMGPVNLSEYGVGVNPFCHTWKKDDIRRYKDDKRHPEEFGNLFHESHARQIASMPFINFTSLWVMFDFPVADRKEGFLDSDDGVNYTENPERMYMNDKGLVTRDRRVRKDSYYLYKAWWNKDETTVYITGRRLSYLPVGHIFTLTVYSNAKSLKLYRDGKEVASADASNEITGVIWTFDNQKMGKDATTFRVVSDDGTEDSVTFQPLAQGR